jgi:conjugative transfer signal peptidase TraF
MANSPSKLASRFRTHAACTLAALALGLGATILRPPRPLLLWNASASSPVGLYAVTAAGRPRAGDMIIAWPPPGARRLAAARGYLPARVPLVKRVAAISGARVCAVRGGVLVNAKLAALRSARDPSGRPMPWWSGCKMLGSGDLFLLAPNARDAFDGRYFGLTRANEVVGKAKLLWRP